MRFMHLPFMTSRKRRGLRLPFTSRDARIKEHVGMPVVAPVPMRSGMRPSRLESFLRTLGRHPRSDRGKFPIDSVNIPRR